MSGVARVDERLGEGPCGAACGFDQTIELGEQGLFGITRELVESRRGRVQRPREHFLVVGRLVEVLLEHIGQHGGRVLQRHVLHLDKRARIVGDVRVPGAVIVRCRRAPRRVASHLCSLAYSLGIDMDNLVNLSPFAATVLPSLDREHEELVLAVVTGHFAIEVGHKNGLASLTVLDEQPPVLHADAYWGDPASSSLREEGQMAFSKPGTDVHLRGHALRPPGQAEAREAWLGLQIGPLRKAAFVIGDRCWVRTLGQLIPSKPLSFERIPIRFERCFGGVANERASKAVRDASAHNPVGRGLVVNSREADGMLLPNFEQPGARISGPEDTPEPAAFGLVARSWLPRRPRGGTYDERWVRERAPRWPADFDPRFFCAATKGLCATPHLTGGEVVSVVGAHRDGELRFALPRWRLVAKFELATRVTQQSMVLDGVCIDTDEMRLSLTWRAHARVGRRMSELHSILVRHLDDWESAL